MDELLRRCADWCAISGCRESTLSNYVLGRGGTLGEIRRGEKGLKPATVDRVLRWLEANPPAHWRARHPQGRPKAGVRRAPVPRRYPLNPPEPKP